MIQKIKNYFTARPKSNFWMKAFLILLVFKYVTPNVLMMMVPFQIGLTGIEGVDFHNTAATVTENILSPMQKLYEAGLSIAKDSPTIAKILYHGYSYFIWIVWVAMILLVLDFIRYSISYFYYKRKDKYLKRKETLISNKIEVKENEHN